MGIREIAVSVVIDTQGRYLLQRRDNIPGIMHPGMISLFGGHREQGETYLQCVAREIAEELTYLAKSNDFEHLIDVDLHEGDDRVRGSIFLLRNVPTDELVVTEGSLLTVNRENLSQFENELTPTARLGLRLT